MKDPGDPTRFLPDTQPGARQWDRGSPTGFSGPRRIHVPLPVKLIRFDLGSEGLGGNVVFDVPIPDCRLRVKMSLVGIPDLGSKPNFLATKSLTLWLAAYEGNRIPVTDLDIAGTISHQAAPVAIPTNGGLGGFSKEFVTAADGIQGVITAANSVDATLGFLYLVTRYQPDAGFAPSEEEWEEIKRAATPSIVGQTQTVE